MKTFQIILFTVLIYTNIKAQTLKELLPSADVIFNHVEIWQTKDKSKLGELISSRRATTKVNVFIGTIEPKHTIIGIESSIFSGISVLRVKSVEVMVNKEDETQNGYLAYCTDVSGKEGNEVSILLVYKSDKLIETSLLNLSDSTVKFSDK